MEIEIAVGVVILLVLIFLATIDMAFLRLSDVGLRKLLGETDDSQRRSSTEFLREILDNRPRFRLALSSTIQVLLIAFTIVVVLLVTRFTDDRLSLVLFTLLIAFVGTVVFRQVLPRVIVRNSPESKLLFLLPVVRPLYRFTSAIVSPFVPSTRTKEMHRLERTAAPDSAETGEDSADDFQALMEVGEAEGIIEEDERELIESMVEFTETRAGEIMTPRTEICAVPFETTIRKARDVMVEEKYSRLPVYRDTIDNIEGVIYVRDLLQAWVEGREDDSIATVLREAYFVPETKSASELLKAMQFDHVQVAIVIDEYGGVAGIVTVEDIIEEIVGEIEDEDIEEEEIIEIIEGDEGYWDVLGSTEIDKVERLLDVDFADPEVSTVAGLITSEVGYIPKVGERLEFRGIEVEIKRADEKKINLVRLRRLDPQVSHLESDASE
jgi:CBS domain containing-hemolysin-like protein